MEKMFSSFFVITSFQETIGESGHETIVWPLFGKFRFFSLSETAEIKSFLSKYVNSIRSRSPGLQTVS